jgi:Phenylalanyl tRNA synthetase beta chain CLM domain
LLPSALKTLAANKDAPLPLRLFEISDVVLLDENKAVGARNERRLVAVQAAREAGFEVLHGLLNRVMDVLGVAVAPSLGGPEKAGKLPRCDWSRLVFACGLQIICSSNAVLQFCKPDASAWHGWALEHLMTLSAACLS